MTATAQGLAGLVEELRVARVAADLSGASLKQALDAFNAEHVNLINLAGTNKARVTFIETQIRAIAAVAFKTDRVKEPVPGVTVKEETEYKYEKDPALEWLKTFAPGLIFQSFNADQFEAMIKPMISAGVAVPCVTIEKTPKVSIAKKLEPITFVPGVVSGVTGEKIVEPKHLVGKLELYEGAQPPAPGEAPKTPPFATIDTTPLVVTPELAKQIAEFKPFTEEDDDDLPF